MSTNNVETLTNETISSIKKRHSTRVFTDEAVTEEEILTLLEAANSAPSAHNQQSWRFVVIKGNKKQELVDIITSSSADFPRHSAALLRMAARSISSAPILIAILNTGELIERGPSLFGENQEGVYDFFRVMEIQSSAAAVENMLIAATSLGLSSVWLGILILIQHKLLNFLGEPDGEFMAVVPVGHAARETNSPIKKEITKAVRYLE